MRYLYPFLTIAVLCLSACDSGVAFDPEVALDHRADLVDSIEPGLSPAGDAQLAARNAPTPIAGMASGHVTVQWPGNYREFAFNLVARSTNEVNGKWRIRMPGSDLWTTQGEIQCAIFRGDQLEIAGIDYDGNGDGVYDDPIKFVQYMIDGKATGTPDRVSKSYYPIPGDQWEQLSLTGYDTICAGGSDDYPGGFFTKPWAAGLLHQTDSGNLMVRDAFDPAK